MIALVLLAGVGVVADSSASVLVALALTTAFFVAGVKVELVGGGFRPLRVLDYIEFNACDALDAYDQEQAAIRARA